MLRTILSMAFVLVAGLTISLYGQQSNQVSSVPMSHCAMAQTKCKASMATANSARVEGTKQLAGTSANVQLVHQLTAATTPNCDPSQCAVKSCKPADCAPAQCKAASCNPENCDPANCEVSKCSAGEAKASAVNSKVSSTPSSSAGSKAG